MAQHPDPLLGPRLKVERAKRHLSEFETAIKAFWETNPYELVRDNNLHAGKIIYRIRVHKCVPPEFSIMAGDVVHNLRSSLDQLVCGLVRANRKQVSGGNGFPIMGSANRFEEACTGKLKNLSPDANRFIRRLKPYNGGNRLLWTLGELDNMDKHNTLVPVASGRAQIQFRLAMPGLFTSPEGGVYLGGGPPGSMPAGWDWGLQTPDDARLIETLEDGCELYRFSPELHSMTGEVGTSFSITFGKTHVTNCEPAFTTLESLIQLVERILDIVECRIL